MESFVELLYIICARVLDPKAAIFIPRSNTFDEMKVVSVQLVLREARSCTPPSTNAYN